MPVYFLLIQVYKRLKLTLELVKKEMEISKIQVLSDVVSKTQPFMFLYCYLILMHQVLVPVCGHIQESIAKAIEEKISGEQRRYLLNEQLKAIKKVFGFNCI